MNSNRIEYGDFQTPLSLAKRVCRLVAASGFRPATVVEPTCGEGVFLAAAADAFPYAMLYGCDRNPRYVEAAGRRVPCDGRLRIDAVDFFSHDWDEALASFADPILVLGNPPWVTSATVGTLGGGNLPTKTNADKLRGIHAITGSANFDISEWMIRQNIRWLDGRVGMVAMLCKTSVARKVLRHAWSSCMATTGDERVGAGLERATIHRIDAAREFGVAVDACLLQIRLGARFKHQRAEQEDQRCDVYSNLAAVTPATTIGWRDGLLLSDVDAYERWSALRSDGFVGWRSGLKHDCSRVFELRRSHDGWRNGGDEPVSVEADVVFPLLKSSDVAHGRAPRKYVLVPQRSMGESPLTLRQRAPKVWRYLLAHQEILDARGSAIYRGRPPFSIFGVGAYSFSPWKVAIAGLYKSLRFEKIAPLDGRPVLLDDTCYFLPCETEADSEALIDLLSSPPAAEFYSALAFWDAKRPITAKLLNQLDLAAVAKHLDKWTSDLARLLARRPKSNHSEQPDLFRSAEDVPAD